MATDDFFRARLDTMIDLRHPMVVLGRKIPAQAVLRCNADWSLPARAR
jgi:IS5 family transposase